MPTMAHPPLLAPECTHAAPPVAGGRRAVSDNVTARALLRRAQGSFQKWPEGFAGFEASARCESPAGVVRAGIRVAPNAAVEVDCADASLRMKLEELLHGLVDQRMPRFFDEGDGRYPIGFADAPADERGRAIDVHTPLGGVRYWIDGAVRVRQVEHVARGHRVLTTFDQLVRATPGRVLPARTTSSVRDASTGALLHSEVAHEEHRRLEHVWLPAVRRVTAGSGGPQSWLEVTLSDHALL
jgi:uncharacterized protein DUF3386